MKDLIILAADKDIEFSLKGLLEHRRNAIVIKNIDFEIAIHPNRDSGCYNQGPDFLNIYLKTYKHCLIVFDRIGCGQESKSSTEIESILEQKLVVCGWGNRAAAVAIDPEVEIIIWADSPHVEKILGWNKGELKDWLIKNKYWKKGEAKPFQDPKEAFRIALRQGQKKPSPSIFYEVASKVGLSRCNDPAFLKIRKKLQEWFPSQDAE